MAFGDSNTYGMPPMRDRTTIERFDAETRWPQVANAALPGWTVIEEGLPGRTAGDAVDPIMGPHIAGPIGLQIALCSHGPIDLLTIMLGTNDTKTHFARTPQQVAGAVAGLIGIAREDEMQARHGGFDILLICPPPVIETGILRETFIGAAATAQALPPLYQALADGWGVGFFDAGKHITAAPDEGVHFTAEAHRTLGAAVGRHIADNH